MKLPHLVIYSDALVPKNFAGWCYGFLVVIKPEYKSDEGLYEHEYTHVQQFYKSFFTMWLWYELSDTKRLRYEAEAYANQVKYGADINHMAWLLSTKYDLDITVDQAKKEIEKYL